MNDIYSCHYQPRGSRLLHGRLGLGDPDVTRLQREVAVHRIVLWAYFGLGALHLLWDSFPP